MITNGIGLARPRVDVYMLKVPFRNIPSNGRAYIHMSELILAALVHGKRRGSVPLHLRNPTNNIQVLKSWYIGETLQGFNKCVLVKKACSYDCRVLVLCEDLSDERGCEGDLVTSGVFVIRLRFGGYESRVPGSTGVAL